MSNENKIVVWDTETTRLIYRGFPIERMEISVACAVIFEVGDCKREPHETLDGAERRVFWHEDVYPKRGENLDRLAELLAECKLHVAFNGIKFDMVLMKQHFQTNQAYKAACERLYDPYYDLVKSIGSFSLAALLYANGIDAKLGKGIDAPDLWDREAYEELEEYCAADVDRLARLVLKPSIRIPGYMIRLPMGTLSMLLDNMSVTPKPVVEAVGAIEVT